MKYYFVTYQKSYGVGTHLINEITDMHPLEYNKKLKKNNPHYSISYDVVWWTELTKEEYDKYK